MYSQYLDGVISLLQRLRDTQGEAIGKAAALVAASIEGGGMVYALGSGHSQLLALEIQGRAGGLYPVVQIMDPLWGRAERVEGYGKVLLQGLPFKAGEAMFVISNSGRNPQPVDVALRARELGLRVIAVTSLVHTQGVASRHSSGKRLFELADVVLDTGTPPGDASLSIPGLAVRTGPVSTTLGAALMNAVMVEAVQKLVERGVVPPVLMSSNLDGGDAHNAELVTRYGPLKSAFGLHL